MSRKRTILRLEELERRELLDASAFPYTNTGNIYLLSDQLNTSNISGQLTTFIGTHFVGTEKLTPGDNAPFKAVNPNWVLLDYRLADTAGPVPYIVNGQVGSDWSTVNAHEDWFMHDPNGNRLYNSSSNWYLMDISNPAWDQYWVNTELANMQAAGAVGVMADSFDAGIGGWWFTTYDPRFAGTNAGNPAAWPNGVTWIDQMENYTNYVQQQFAAAPGSPLFIPNVDGLNTTWDDFNNNLLDGAFLENFGVGPGYLGGTTDDWVLSMNRALPLSADGKVLILQPYLVNDANSTLGIEQRGYELGTYLLLQGDHTYLNVVGPPYITPSTQAFYYPEDTIQMGAPLTPVATDVSQYAWDGVYRRDFQNGIVLVNPSNTTITIPLGQPYELVSFTGGGELTPSSLDANGNYIGGSLSETLVNTVTLTPSTAAILMNTTSGSSQTITIDNGSSGYSQSGSGWGSYTGGYNGSHNYHAAGTGAEAATWQASNLAAGTYTISADWLSGSNHASNATYQIYDGNGNLLATSTVNQQNASSGTASGGVNFQNLATVTLANPGSIKVVLSDNANQYIYTDAVQVTGGTALPPAPVLVDNSSASYSQSGTGWASSTGGLNGSHNYHAAGTGAEAATWQVSNLAAGTYTVGADWTSGSNHASNATYKIYDGNGNLLATTTVNQQNASVGANTAGVNFQSLATVTLTNPGSLKVVLSDNANNYIYTDAIQVISGTPPPIPVVIDNGQSGYSQTGSGWASTQGGYNASHAYHAAGTGANTANWQFNNLAAGTYTVGADWLSGSNHATNATYKIYDGNGNLLATTTVNQQNASTGVNTNGVIFQNLATVTLSSLGSLKLVLSDNANQYIYVDAAEVVSASPPASPPPPPPPPPPPSSSVIIDNGSSGYSQSGSGWGSYTGGYNGSHNYHAAGTGAEAATWQANNLAAGTYTVSADWLSGSNHASNATYKIYDGNGNLLATSTVNQQNASTGTASGGVNFQNLATVTLSSPGSLKVVLSDNANNYVYTDAVQITSAPSAPVVIDNGQSGYSQSGSGWGTWTGGYNGSHSYHAAGTGAEAATWQASNLAAGTYTISADWTGASNHPTNATYKIYDGNGNLLATTTVNQQIASLGTVSGGVNFQNLATVTLANPGSLKVVLTDNANNYIYVDAVRFAAS